jgi:hypothetical protein
MKIGDSPSRNTLTIVFSKSYNAFEGRIYFRESFNALGFGLFLSLLTRHRLCVRHPRVCGTAILAVFPACSPAAGSIVPLCRLKPDTLHVC